MPAMTERFLLTTSDRGDGGMEVTIQHRAGALTARHLFDPVSVPPRLALMPAPDGPVVVRDVLRGRRPVALARSLLGTFRDFYRDPVAWVALLITSVLLCYAAGLVMFWFHAEALGEGGPAISWYAHWILDSTFGFIALTPALALIMPIAVWAAAAGTTIAPRLMPWLYTSVAGVLFALVTVPGPIAHNLIVGRGTWIANQVTQLIGSPGAPPSAVHHYPAIAEMTQQLGFGVILYVVTVAVSLPLIRFAVRPRAVFAQLRYRSNADAVAERT
jgi:hypothetical protein